MSELRFNFVINTSENECRSLARGENLEEEVIGARGDLSWCFEAYRTLSKRNNLQVLLSNALQTNTINIIHASQLIKAKRDAACFMVCVQSDLPRMPWAHYHLVQNETQVAYNATYMPHWVQPNIVPRNKARAGITQVAYVGPVDGAGAVTEEEWQSLFRPHHIAFEYLSGPWNNLSEVDVLIGIRSFDGNSHPVKPPSRLFSAWHAHVAFIGGSDSAYQQVGTPGKDYLMAQTPRQVLEAVLHLRKNNSLFDTLIANGKQKTLQYNNDVIAQHWEAVLGGPVLQRYLRWKARPQYEKIRFQSFLRLGLQ
jgi:hypothetical protein